MRNFICLLIDDDEDDLEIFGMSIASVDSTIFYKGISEPLIAIELLKAKEILPNCIFIDHNMPRMNGEQCLREIEKLPHLSNVPKYIYSTSSEKELKTRLIASGATGFITKPKSLSELNSILKELLLTHKNELQYV